MANNDNSGCEDDTTKTELLEIKSMFKVMMERMDSLSAEVHALKINRSNFNGTSHSIPIIKDAVSHNLEVNQVANTWFEPETEKGIRKN